MLVLEQSRYNYNRIGTIGVPICAGVGVEC